MKINVAVHILLFNILSVRQTYCLSIGGDWRVWGKSPSVSPRSLWDTYDGQGSIHSATNDSTQDRTLHICSTKVSRGGSFHKFSSRSWRIIHFEAASRSKQISLNMRTACFLFCLQKDRVKSYDKHKRDLIRSIKDQSQDFALINALAFSFTSPWL